MRGAPILRFVLALLVLGVAGIPIWVLTRPAPVERAAPPVPAASPMPSSPIRLRLTSLPAAESLSVSYLGRVLASSASGSLEVALDVSDCDLVIEARWAEKNVSSAVRVLAIQDARTVLDTTLWGEGTLEGVATIPSLAP